MKDFFYNKSYYMYLFFFAGWFEYIVNLFWRHLFYKVTVMFVELIQFSQFESFS